MMNKIPTIFRLLLILCCIPTTVIAQELIELQPHARELLLTGFTRPVVKMTLTAEVNGKCREMRVDVGDVVPGDEVVSTIDDTFVRLDLEKNSIERRKTMRQLELEEKNLSRYTSLIQENSTAQAIYDEALQNTQILELTLQGLRAEKDRLEELLTRHTLTAPEGWRVIERFIEPGEYIRQGDPILELGNFNTLIVPFMLTYEELELLRNMENITLFFPDVQRSLNAEIFRVSPYFDSQKKKIRVELKTLETLIDQNSLNRAGLRAQLRIRGKIENTAFQIPFSALINRYEARWVVTEDGTRHKVILLGKSESGDQAIISGSTLRPGKRVLILPINEQ
ncbi:MAG: efflux RND transporter periplasmic adaptor subunit [Desulfocapsaceae bacterium]|nr:efflux RND transporter periplasmic adaptor subunit [Desulfocapsaceae bacterium]